MISYYRSKGYSYFRLWRFRVEWWSELPCWGTELTSCSASVYMGPLGLVFHIK